MPSKNDLSALKSEPDTPAILPDKPAVTRLTKKAVGRPKKKPAEKRDYKITLSLTQAEGKKIAAKAGLAGEATYLYAMLEKAGIFK